jgi:hypothetical protein
MTARSRLGLVGASGLGLYGCAVAAALVLHSQFWTSRAMGESVPWYFIGQSLVGGACAAVAFALTVVLGVLSRSTCGPAVWSSLAPAVLFLSYPIGQGVNVLLHTRRIWAGLSAASSQWKTFDEYLYSNTSAGLLTVALVAGMMFVRRHSSSEGAA